MHKISEWNKLDLKGKVGGKIQTTCPECSESRKKRTEKCVSINISEGFAKCNHCDTLFFKDENSNKAISDIKYTLPIQELQNYNFNMKKSAIDAYNELPESLKIENQLVIDKTINGFETLTKGFGMVRKVEVEIEYELEKEVEVENSIIDVRFEKFWNLYDKKTGKEKTEKAFLKLYESEISTIFRVLKKYVESTPDKKFRKDPLTWINGKHFNDEIFITTKQTQSAHNKLTL